MLFIASCISSRVHANNYLFQILKTTDIELQICHSDWLYHDTMVIIGQYDEVSWECEDRARIMQSKLHNCASLLLCCSAKLLMNCARFCENKMVLHPNSAVPDGHEGDAKEEAEDAAHLSNHGG